MADRFLTLRRNENIWTARDLETGNQVLLKCIYSDERPSFDTKNYEGSLEAFCLRELPKLNAERIVNLISSYRQGKSLVLAVEKAHCSLADALLLRPKLSESEAKGVIRCLLEALVACHSMNIVHRNVNPENMFLFSDELDSLKLGGFDISLMDKDGLSTCIGLR
ncbi:hypothetical protein HDU81_010199, partial [Chytriomyces hyalinus]